VVTDIENHMDRVLELLNRTNQLNYTKVRANSGKERDELDVLLATSGMHAGLIHVQDRYGDYGAVGFFCVRTKFSGTTVHHLAFSCRALNMGLEQWVWEYLGRPEFEPAMPVANPIKSFDTVDWIRQVDDFSTDAEPGGGRHICLVGGCDLLQTSFYCGSNRDEFVNKPDENGMLVRFDDIGFFLNPRDHTLKHSKELREFVGYTRYDMLDLDRALAEADLILLSMYFSVPSDLLFTFGGKEFGGRYWGTVPPRRFKKLMRKPEVAMRFAKTMFHRRLPIEDRLDLTRRCFAYADKLRRTNSPMYILGSATQHGQQALRSYESRVAFNAMCREYCDQTANAIFIDVDHLLQPDEFADSDHFTRTGYYRIAQFVNDETDRIAKATANSDQQQQLPEAEAANA
jgi:hypothetical protein